MNWKLIDKPFDPAAPSMLLFDMRGTDPVLVGFSYWLRADLPPTGFAGANDHWHQHSGLCIVNGWVDREEVEGPNLCAGSYLGGRDLWMLHAWVAPGFANRWGDFADTNPLLCPPVASTPDIARLPERSRSGMRHSLRMNTFSSYDGTTIAFDGSATRSPTSSAASPVRNASVSV